VDKRSPLLANGPTSSLGPFFVDLASGLVMGLTYTIRSRAEGKIELAQ